MHIFLKTSRILLFVGLIIFIIITALEFFVDPLAKKFLEKQVSKAGDGQYTLKLENLHVALWQGDVLLEGVSVSTDTSKSFQGPVIFSDAERIFIDDFAWTRLITLNQLIIERVETSPINLRIILRKEPAGKAKKPFSLQQLDVYPYIKGRFDKVAISKIDLNLNFSAIQKSLRDTLSISVEQLNVKADDVLLDEGQIFTESRAFYAEGIGIEGERLAFSNSGAVNYKGSVNHLVFNTKEREAGVAMESIDFFYQQKDIPDTALYFRLQDFLLQKLNLDLLQKEKVAELDKVLINNLEFLVNHQGREKSSSSIESSKEESFKNFSLSAFLPPFLEKVKLAEIEVKEVSGAVKDSFVLKDANLIAEQIVVDTSSAFDQNRFLHSTALESQVGLLKLAKAGSLEKSSFGQLEVTSQNGLTNVIAGNFIIHSAGQSPEGRWKVEAQGFLMEGLNTRAFPEGRLAINLFAIIKPDVDITITSAKSREHLKAGKPEELLNMEEIDVFPALGDQVDQISVDKISLEDVSLKVLNKTEGWLINAPSLNLKSRNILIGPGEIYSPSRTFYAREWELEAAHLNFQQQTGWKAFFGAVHASINENNADLSMGSMALIHKGSVQEDTTIAVDLEEFLLAGLDMDKLIQDREVVIDLLDLNVLDVYHNQPDPEISRSPDPNAAANQSFDIRELSLENYLPDAIQQVAIDAFEVDSFSYLQESNQLKIEEGKLEMAGLKVQRNNAFQEKRFFHAREIEGLLNEVSYPTESEEAAVVKMGEFRFLFSQGRGALLLQDIILEPLEPFSVAGLPELAIDAVRLKGIHTGGLSSAVLVVDSLTIEEPILVVDIPTAASEPSGQQTGKLNSRLPDLYSFTKEYLDTLLVKSLIVEEGNIRFSGLGDSYYGLHIPELNLYVDSLLLAPETAFEESSFLHSSDIRADLQDLHYLFPDNVYFLQIRQASLSTAEKDLELKDLRYGYSENYPEKLEEDSVNEVYRIVNEQLKAENINWKKLIMGEGFKADKVISEDLDLYIYKDFNVPYVKQYKPLPADIVNDLELPLLVRELVLNDMEVTYEELKKGAEKAGIVTVGDLDVSIHNLTNVDRILIDKPSMEVVGSGQLMGKGYFQTHLNVPLLDPGKPIRVTGTMDTLDITALNRIARYNSILAIKSGSFNKVSWDFEAGEDKSVGQFAVSYDNLEIQLANPNSPDTTGLIKQVGSYLINKVVVESNIAEDKKEPPKRVDFKEERNKERSFFHFYVQSLLAGLIEAVGIPFQ